MGRPALRWIESGTRLEYAWVAFAILNLAAMLTIIELRFGQGWETVPFHFIYVSFTILYGFRAWRGRATLWGILFVTVSTGAVTAFGIYRNWEAVPEFTEVPLMSLMFLGMVYHVRRRQQAQAVAEALAAERERDLERKSVFLSDASHELLTPITIGRGHLELLQREPSAGPAEVTETCDVVLGELGRMERVINRLLLLESADATAPRAFERVDAPEVVTEVFQRWRHRRAGVDPLRRPPRHGCGRSRPAHARPRRAGRERHPAHPPGPADRDGRDRRAGTLRIRVRDGGDGIPEAAQARVFDRFYRVDGARNRKNGGVGLGLAIVKAIAEAHGGGVTVSSRVGRGSTFELRLPGLRSAGDEPVAAPADGLDHGFGLEFAP